MRGKQNKYMKIDMREEEDEEGLRSIYRRDSKGGTELKTLKKMAQARDQYMKWINDLTLKGKKKKNCKLNSHIPVYNR